jgi:hypothetical protein
MRAKPHTKYTMTLAEVAPSDLAGAQDPQSWC